MSGARLEENTNEISCRDIEVIGNIYENIGLLEKETELIKGNEYLSKLLNKENE